jgi:hypothetical protein
MSSYRFNVKTQILSACICAAAALATLSANPARAQSPARNDKVMTIAELRACMTLEQSNKKAAAEILQEQDGFKRDQDAVKAEQAGVNKANDEVRARSAMIVAERDAISTLVSALNTKAEAAKTDADKAEVEAERVKLVERSRLLEQNIDSFNASQQALRDRVAALNARIDAINLRNKTINDRIEPQQKQVATWRDLCGNRRFREEEEVVIKKELAAGK